MAPPEASGSLTLNEGSGPFTYGTTLTFTAETAHLRGGYPMVEVALYQDRGPEDENGDPTPGDGTITMDLWSTDLVGLTLNHPQQPVPLPPGGSTDTALAAKGWARLLRYAWKGGQQSITELDRVEFDVTP